jgi:hypothetical protein
MPLRLLAQAGGYAHVNSIRLQELGYRSVSPKVRDFVASYQPPPLLTGPALRDWRERQWLTVAQLGLCLHVTESAVRMWELGYRRVPWHARLYVARHPAPAGPRARPAAPRPANRAEVLAAVQAGAETVLDVLCALPAPAAYRTVRAHLQQLTRAGVLVGSQQRSGYRNQPKHWRVAVARGVGRGEAVG